MTKDTSEVYRLNIDSYRCQWATITINKTGDLNIISDCGNFTYSWRMNENEDFKDLLIRICKHGEGRGYLYDKIHDYNRANRVDTVKTITPLKRELFQYYREKKRDSWFMEKDREKIYPQLDTRMRDAYDELTSIESEGDMSEDNFYNQIYSIQHVNEIFNGNFYEYLDVEYIGDRQATAFCEIVAPIFAEVLRKEKEQSKNKQI